MEFGVASSVLVALLAVCVVAVLRSKLGGGGGKKRLPPGPMGLPLLGRLPFLPPVLHHHFADLAKTYGPVFSFRLGTQLCISVTDTATAADVLKVHDQAFASHPPPDITTAATATAGMVFSPYGPHWRLVRRVAVRELLIPAVIDSFAALRGRAVRRMVAELRAGAGGALNVRNIIYNNTLNVLSSMMWGDELEEEAREVFEDAVELVGAPNISDFIPALAPLDLMGLRRKTQAWRKRYDAIFERIVKGKERRRGDANNKTKDFLDLLMDLVARNDPDTPFEVKHIQALLLDLIIGATDTTATSIEWTMSELARHPEALRKATEELDAVVGKGRVVQEEDVGRLPFLDAVVKEALRLHPLLPLLIPHLTSADCEVGGYEVPAGTRAFVNVWAIQRDPAVWEAPLEFRPERFLDRGVKWDQNGTAFDWLPFGGGRRICPGTNLAERMVLYFLGTILHAFDWQLPPGVATVGVDEKLGLVVKKKDPLILCPSLRLPLYANY